MSCAFRVVNFYVQCLVFFVVPQTAKSTMQTARTYGGKAAKIVVLPITHIAGKMHRAAERSVYTETDSEYAAQMDKAQKDGTDLAAQATLNFVTFQMKTVPYRVVKLGDELQELASLRPLWKSLEQDPTGGSFGRLKSIVYFARVVTRLFFVYMLFLCLGRGSIWPLRGPNSPFAKENIVYLREKKPDPNELPQLVYYRD